MPVSAPPVAPTTPSAPPVALATPPVATSLPVASSPVSGSPVTNDDNTIVVAVVVGVAGSIVLSLIIGYIVLRSKNYFSNTHSSDKSANDDVTRPPEDPWNRTATSAH